MKTPALQMPLRIPVSLHNNLKQAAEAEGLSLNQYCLYLLANNVTRSSQWMTQKGESLLRFLAEAQHLQKEFKRGKRSK